MRKSFALIFFLPLTIFCQSNLGGKNTLSFLTLPINARVAGLGGELVSQYNDDPNLARYNPAAANHTMSGSYSLNYMKYYGDVYMANTNFAYCKDSTKLTWVGNLSYIDYGRIDSYDDGGNYIGTYRSRDFSAVASAAKKLDNYSLGASIGLANSNIAGYNAYAVFMDIGGVYIHPSKPISVGLLIKNLGFNFNNYRSGNPESLPVDIQTGVTLKPEHMPLRFNITLHKLYRYNTSYYDPDSKLYVDQQSDVTNQKPSFLEKTIRHVNIGLEGILSKNFNLRAGYSFMRRQDLKYQTGTSGWAGFSFGGMIRIKRFSFEYTQIFHHVAGSKGIITLNVKI